MEPEAFDDAPSSTGEHAPADSIWTLVEASAHQGPGEVLLSDDHGCSLTAQQLRDEADRHPVAHHTPMGSFSGPRTVLV
jgi:hypothetical protein